MPDAIPACFRAAAAPGGRASSAAASALSGAGTSLATSVYDTRLGLAALSWSRAALGLSLRAVLRVSAAGPHAPSPSAASDYGDDGGEVEYEGECHGDDEETVAVRVRPWLLWRRRGSKRFRVRGRRVVDLAWDLSRARFPASGGSPEPCSGYFVAVVVDGEMAVVAGDMAEEAYRKTKARRPPGPGPVLVSRREHVSMRDGGGRGHRTCVVVRGKEREISVDLVSRAAQGRERERERERDRAEVGMSVSVDGDRVLHVRRLRWKFRGTEKVDLGGGDRVLVSWDLHNWLFPARDTSPPDAAAAAAAAAALAAAVTPPAHAVFVFRFELAGCNGEERDPAADAKEELLDSAGGGGGGWAGYVGRWGRGDWSESSSNGEKRRRKRGQASRLAKASSSSSASVASSSASWASGSTVMDWGSPEEAELQSGDGFSLLVYAWKNYCV